MLHDILYIQIQKFLCKSMSSQESFSSIMPVREVTYSLLTLSGSGTGVRQIKIIQPPVGNLFTNIFNYICMIFTNMYVYIDV